MRAVSNTGASPSDSARRTASRLTAGNIEKDLAAAGLRKQRRHHRFGRGAVIGDQRADLAALAARADHAPAGEPAVAHQRATDGPDVPIQARRNAGRGAGKTAASDASTIAKGTSLQRNDALRRRRSCDRAAIADIGVGEPEAGLPVVLLLRHHAVEADHAAGCMRDRGVPDAQAKPAAAQIRRTM